MTETTGDEDFLTMANTGIEFAIPVAHRMGVRIVEARPGHIVGEVPAEGNTNHIGTVYAGVLFTVAEILGGAMAMSTFDASAYYPIVKDLRITFRRPAKTTVRAATSLDADTIAATAAAAAEHGKADYVLDAELTDEDGTVVATTHGIYQLRRFGS